MKQLLIAITLSLFFIHMALAGMQTDKEREGLVGPVQSIRVEFAKFSRESGKWLEGPRNPLLTTVCDERGNWLEKTNYGSDGSIIGKFKWSYTYDAEGNITQRVSSIEGPPTISSKVIYTYDSKRNIIEEVSYTNGKPADTKIVYTYDAKGNIIQKGQYYNDGSLAGTKVINSYDAKGNVTEEASYTADGSLLKKWIYGYDVKGDKTEAVNYKNDGIILSKQIYKYDTKGNRIETVYNADTSPSSKETASYDYDSMGNWTKETTKKITFDKSGKEQLESLDAIYQTITYYPTSKAP